MLPALRTAAQKSIHTNAKILCDAEDFLFAGVQNPQRKPLRLSVLSNQDSQCGKSADDKGNNGQNREENNALSDGNDALQLLILNVFGEFFPG